MAAKFKEGDRVKVKINLINPGVVGKTGRVTKVLEDANTGESLYRVILDGHKHPLRGVAEEDCIELVSED